MTVTEVTTRIVIVGVVTLLGLFVVSRRSLSIGSMGQPSFSGKQQHFVTHTPEHQIPDTQGGLAHVLAPRPVGFVARIMSLSIVAVTAGLALGVGLSLALVTVLNALGSGAN